MIILPFTCYLRLKDRWNINSPGFNKDLLLYQNELRDAVPDDALVIAGNDISHYIFFYYINKKGWAFHKNKISKDEILTMIEEGATYLYSDSEFIRENEEIDALLEKEILRKGSISIFKLKRKAN